MIDQFGWWLADKTEGLLAWGWTLGGAAVKLAAFLAALGLIVIAIGVI